MFNQKVQGIIVDRPNLTLDLAIILPYPSCLFLGIFQTYYQSADCPFNDQLSVLKPSTCFQTEFNLYPTFQSPSIVNNQIKIFCQLGRFERDQTSFKFDFTFLRRKFSKEKKLSENKVCNGGF